MTDTEQEVKALYERFMGGPMGAPMGTSTAAQFLSNTGEGAKRKAAQEQASRQTKALGKEVVEVAKASILKAITDAGYRATTTVREGKVYVKTSTNTSGWPKEVRGVPIVYIK